MNKGNRSRPKNPVRFTAEEDLLLVQCVGNSTKIDWDEVVSHFTNRSRRQLRERWHIYLAPGINLGCWSDVEDELLVKLISQIGPFWSRLAKHFEGRSQMSIKNRWNSHLKKVIRVNNSGEYVLIDHGLKKSQQTRNSKQLERHHAALKVLNRTRNSKKISEFNTSSEYNSPSEDKAENNEDDTFNIFSIPDFAPDSIFLGDN